MNEEMCDHMECETDKCSCDCHWTKDDWEAYQGDMDYHCDKEDGIA